jgi:serine/threonine protein kinase
LHFAAAIDTRRSRIARALRALANRFELRTKLGRGASADAYEAIDVASNERVVVKLYARDPSSLAQRRREIEALRALGDRRGIPRLIAEDASEGGVAFVAMTRCEGAPLSARLDEPMSSEQVRALALALCDPLEALHRSGWVHCDLKPEHVVVQTAADGAVIAASLVDFGIAAPMGSRRSDGEGIVGTLGFVAPELLRERRATLDAACDIYALGCVLFHAASGAYPFAASDDEQRVARVLAGFRVSLRWVAPHIDRSLASLIDRMLSDAPADRPPSVAAIRRALIDERASARENDGRAGVVGSAIAVILGSPRSAHSERDRMELSTEEGRGHAEGYGIDATLVPSDAWSHRLSDGSILLCLRNDRVDRPFVARTLQSALLLASTMTDRRWTVALSHGAMIGHWPRGAAMDHALELRSLAGPGEVVVDSLTALFADGQFDLEPLERAFIVRGPR